MLGRVPKGCLRILQEPCHRVGVPQLRPERQKVGAGAVEELRVLDVGIAACYEVINDDVGGATQVCGKERVCCLEDGRSGDAELRCSGVDVGADLGEL